MGRIFTTFQVKTSGCWATDLAHHKLFQAFEHLVVHALRSVFCIPLPFRFEPVGKQTWLRSVLQLLVILVKLSHVVKNLRSYFFASFFGWSESVSWMFIKTLNAKWDSARRTWPCLFQSCPQCGGLFGNETQHSVGIIASRHSLQNRSDISESSIVICNLGNLNIDMYHFRPFFSTKLARLFHSLYHQKCFKGFWSFSEIKDNKFCHDLS